MLKVLHAPAHQIDKHVLEGRLALGKGYESDSTQLHRREYGAEHLLLRER